MRSPLGVSVPHPMLNINETRRGGFRAWDSWGVGSSYATPAMERFPPLASYNPSHRSTQDGPNMTIAEFTSELTRLIKKCSIAGLCSNDMADKLTDAAEHLT